MKRTLDDLRAALHDEADAAAYPNVDALVAGAGRRVGAARRRRRVALGVATVAVLVVGGLVATRPADKVVPRPAGPGPYTVNAGGAGFPEFTMGMKRLMVLDAPLPGRAEGSVVVATTAGQELAVAMTCSPFTEADQSGWITMMTTTITGPGGGHRTGCVMPISMLRPETIGVASAATTTVSADVFATSDPAIVATPKSAKVHFAIYQSVPFQGYPFPARPRGVNAPTWDGTYPSGTSGPYGPRTVTDANKALSVSFDYNPKWDIQLEVRGPGRLRVLIDGINVSGSIPAGMRMPVRDGYLTKWDYDSVGTSFPLDPTIAPWPPAGSWTSGPPIKPGTQVSLVIIPADFTGPDWRVTYGPSPN